MINLNWSSAYKKAFKKTVKNDSAIKIKILETMGLLQTDETEILLMDIGTHDEVY